VAANIAGVNAFCQAHDIPSYFMLVPGAAWIQRDKLPAFAQTWDQTEFIEDVQIRLEKAVPVAACQALAQHSEDDIYFRTDHHWTAYGAYLAYEQFCLASHRTPKPISEMNTRTVTQEFNGTLYSKSGVRWITPDTIDVYQSGDILGLSVYDGKNTTEYPSAYFAEYLSQKDKYSYFLGTNQPLVTVHTGSESDKKLLVFKDSYAHCLVPMLCADFRDITLVDLRYFGPDAGEKIDFDAYDEALFLYSTDVFSQQSMTAKLGEPKT
jgi:hypothetical protein